MGFMAFLATTMKNPMNIYGKTIFSAQARGLSAIGLALSLGLTAAAGLALAETPGEKDAKYGKTPVAMCIGCHGIEGYKASFPTVYLVPKISGQSQKYIENALQAYRKGERSHPSMRAIAGSLTDADITALATYYSKNLSAGAAQ
jgi:cytochrome c553